MVGSRRGRARGRHPQEYGGAFTGSGFDLERGADQRGTLVHAQQSEAPTL
jgi:hypothetical protein